MFTDSTPFSDAPSTGSLPTVGELPLPDSGAPKLEHLGKQRPRRQKNRAVSRAVILDDDELTAPSEDGLTSFFEKASMVSEGGDKPNGVAGEAKEGAKNREEKWVFYGVV